MQRTWMLLSKGLYIQLLFFIKNDSNKQEKYSHRLLTAVTAYANIFNYRKRGNVCAARRMTNVPLMVSRERKADAWSRDRLIEYEQQTNENKIIDTY